MARKKKKEELKVFTITCLKCGFTGTPDEFDISAETCDCGGCSCGAEITIECRKCDAEMGVEGW